MRRILSLVVLLAAFLPAVPALALTCNCKPPSRSEKICLTIDADRLTEGQRISYNSVCNRLPSVVGDSLQGWICDPAPLTETQEQQFARGGVCVTGPMDAFAASTPSEPARGSGSRVDGPAILPSLNVPIPGLAFTSGDATTEQSSLFAQYIAAAYRYLITIAAVVATIMFVWGAFLFLIGSALPSIQKGKTIMMDAVVGLLLVLAANFILRTINPATLELSALNVGKIEPVAYADSLFGNVYAPEVLSDLGVRSGGGAGRSPTYTIPLDCPGRSRSSGGVNAYYSFDYKGTTLTPETIQKYLEEQERTGIPAAVIMAQMFNEGGGSCPVVNLFGSPATCGGLHSANYNFGGIGCTQTQVPADACAHLAFTKAGVGAPPGKGTAAFEMSVADVNRYWNSKIHPNCTKLITETTRDTYQNCGPVCYPQKSHTTVRIDGKEIWIQSVQCSRKFDGPQAFLDAHLRAVKACIPYNDSVYKFAYCIGASTYASAGQKAKVLADIIERNCLCDPAHDSMGCQRDRKLEQDIANETVKKTNLFKLYSAGKLDEAAYDRIADSLWKATGGRLTPGPREAILEEAEIKGQEGLPPS